MTQPKTASIRQKNKNNKTKPENLMKKEYLEDYEELKKSITEQQKANGSENEAMPPSKNRSS